MLKKRTSPKGIQLIKDAEGVVLKAYRCPAGVLTIGAGHTEAAGLPRVFEGMTVTAREAEEILKSDLRKFELDVNNLVKVPLTQSQFDALISFVFNIGSSAFKKSTLLKKLNAGDYNAVPNEMMRWNKVGKKVSKGLTNRRAKEAALWVDDSWEEDDTPTPQGNIKRNVPALVTKENVAMFTTATTGIGAANIDATNPMAYALAIIMVIGFVVMLYFYLKKRGA